MSDAVPMKVGRTNPPGNDRARVSREKNEDGTAAGSPVSSGGPPHRDDDGVGSAPADAQGALVIGAVGADTSNTRGPSPASAARSVASTSALRATWSELPHSTREPSASEKDTVS